MKKQIGSLTALLLAASGFFFSCGDNMNRNVGDLRFDSLTVNQTAHLFGDTAKPACNLVINFAYASHANDPRLKDSVNSCFLAACFGEAYVGMKPEEAVQKYAEQYVGNYLGDLEPMYQKDEQEGGDKESVGSWYAYYQTLESHVTLCVPMLMTYRIDYNEYTGGAHGIYTTSFLNLNLTNLTPYRLSDLFEEGYRKPLTELLWKRLMADNKVGTREELEDMGFGTTGDLEPTENFYLTTEGITFYYNVYDIAPYVMGATPISLSYKEITPLMSEELVTLSHVIKTETF